MRPTPFYKLSGAGNDFVAILADHSGLPDADQIRSWCRRRLSIGADGLFLLEQIATDPAAIVRMHYFNADGGRADLCGNGTRCAARLAQELGWYDPADENLVLETDVGPLMVRLDDQRRDWAEVATPEPPEQPKTFELDEQFSHAGLLAASYVVVGVPHLVVVGTAPLDALDLTELGPPLRHHPRLHSDGANVNFAVETEPGQLTLRTWERGVEGETLACGSGAVATALSSELLFGRQLPISLRVRSGDLLEVRRASDGTVLQSGPARLVARGELL